jgi:hypothetical protein
MEPVTLILTALATGALVGATDAAQTAVKDAYHGLKDLVQRRFGDDAKASAALEMFESNPDETIATYLRPHLVEYQVPEDSKISAAADELLRLASGGVSAGAGSTFVNGNLAQFADRGGVSQVGGNIGSISTTFNEASGSIPNEHGKPRP